MMVDGAACVLGNPLLLFAFVWIALLDLYPMRREDHHVLLYSVPSFSFGINSFTDRRGCMCQRLRLLSRYDVSRLTKRCQGLSISANYVWAKNIEIL